MRKRVEDLVEGDVVLLPAMEEAPEEWAEFLGWEGRGMMMFCAIDRPEDEDGLCECHRDQLPETVEVEVR